MGIKQYKCFFLVSFIFFCGYYDLFAELFVSRICEYPEEQYSENIYIISEDVYIDINQNYEYTARYEYLIKNRGDTIVIPLGFFFRPLPQSGGTFEDKPEIVHFKINDEKINPIIVQTESLPNNDRVVADVWFDRVIIGWIYTSIQFGENEVIKIELLYTSNYNQSQYGPAINYESYPFLLKTGDDTVTNIHIVNNWDDIYFTGITSKSNVFENSFSSFDVLRQNKTLSSDLYAISKINEKSWLISVSKNFVDKYAPFFGFYFILKKTWSPSGLTPYFSVEDNGVLIYLRDGQDEKIINISETVVDMTLLIFMTNNQLRLIRNAFYARHHYPFHDINLVSFFSYNSRGYYSANDAFNEKMLTEIERSNIEIIKNLENTNQIINRISKPEGVVSRYSKKDSKGPENQKIGSLHQRLQTQHNLKFAL
jgi:hypothetical protein